MRGKVWATLAMGTLLAGCVYGPPPPPGPGGVAVSANYYDAYYDGAYGPFVDGYWGDDGGFWYQDREHHWNRDGGQHFRRQSRYGFAHVHGAGAHREH